MPLASHLSMDKPLPPRSSWWIVCILRSKAGDYSIGRSALSEHATAVCRQQVIFPLEGGSGGRFLTKGSGVGGYPDDTWERARKVQEAILRAIAKADHLVARGRGLGFELQ